MLRIAYVVSQYPTLGHTFIAREINELRALGHSIGVVSILAPDRTPEALTTTEREEFESCYYVRRDLMRWPALHLQALFTRPVRYLAGLAMAARCSHGSIPQLLRHLRYFGEAIPTGLWVRKQGFTHMHTHFASFTALLASRIFGIPFSITLHGPAEFIDPAGQSLPEKLSHARLAIAISNYGASQIMLFSDAADWHKVRTVRLGIDARNFLLPPAPGRAGPFRIVSVGRLAKVKAHAILVEAFARIRQRFPDTELVLIGAGPERTALENLAARLGVPVEFTGGLHNDQVRQRVQESHCFALSSFAEGVPVVLMEAMALGVPCVATRVMGIPELIEHNTEGLLVDPGTPEALAAAIQLLIEQPGLAERFRLAAREKVLREYDITTNVRKLSAYFESECGDR